MKDFMRSVLQKMLSTKKAVTWHWIVIMVLLALTIVAVVIVIGKTYGQTESIAVSIGKYLFG